MLDKSLYCSGLEGHSLGDFITRLNKLNISILIDIRANPDQEVDSFFNMSVLREEHTLSATARRESVELIYDRVV